MEPRKEEEKKHYNTLLRRILENPKAYNWRYGSSLLRSSIRRGYIFCENFLAQRCAGKQVLDYGCGTGIHSIHIAKNGAFVTGIDISDVAIEIAKMRVQRESK